MSKYTTEVRFICENAYGLTESVGYTRVDEVIAGVLNKIFDFDFPIFDENYRSILETKILKHYYTREIGLETVGLWKLKLETKLNEIMPFYNKLYESELLEFNPFYSKDLHIEHAGKKNDIGHNNGEVNSTNSGTTKGLANTSSDLINKYADTPQGSINDLLSDRYLTNATNEKTNGVTMSDKSAESKGSVNSNETNVMNSVDSFLDHIYGYEGYYPSKMLKEYRETFLNIDMQVINELEELFMQLW